MSDELKPTPISSPNLGLSASTFRTGEDPQEVELLRGGETGGEIIERVTVTHEGGVEIFEGDIDLTPSRAERPELRQPTAQPYGLTIRHGHGQWPNGQIYYVTEEVVRPVVERAITHWEARTPLRFREGTGSGDYVSFEDRGLCRSKIGRVGGAQLVELHRACTVGDAIHEIGHVVGLWHEQSRPDRDQHVRIIAANVRAGEMHNFNVHDGSAVNRGAYDLQSIMHYPSDAFSKGGPTIVTLAGDPIPHRNGLSSGDVAAVRELYRSLNW